jgi:hypothetical protein
MLNSKSTHSNMTTSMISNLSIEAENNYHNISMEIAIDIFDEYLRRDADYEVEVDGKLKCQIYAKFGCETVSDITSKLNPFSYNTEMINEEILLQNLNQYLFFDLYSYTLD